MWNDAIPKLSYLSAVIMLNLGSAGVMAAEQAGNGADDMEVITVSGIRGSLIKSKDIKRDAGNIVDAITAEDIGKFPDQNVAESLQRIPGVSIDREGGEGQLITVRGLGPEFNSVLVNGRTMATISGGRSFSFDTLASELISGAEVHKTQSAKLQEGAIGATVNITTLKPLSMPGFQAASSVKALYDDMTGSTRPQFSGLVSNTFNDDKFGVLLSYAHSDRKSRYDEANTSRYMTRDLNLDDGTVLTDIEMPRNYDQIAQTETRKRDGGTLVLQYRPSDELTLTADALYSKYTVDYRQDVLAHWFTADQVTHASLDENDTVVKLTMGRGSNTDYLNRLSHRPTETQAVGFNADWQISSDLTLVGDISYSKATSDNAGGTTDTVASYANSYTFDNTAGALLPTIQFNKDLSTDGIKAGWGSRFGSDVEDEVMEAKIDGEWAIEAGPLVKVGFGAMYSDRTLASTYAETNWRVSVLFGDNPTPIILPQNLFSLYDGDGFLSGASGNPPQEWLRFDSEEFFAYLMQDEVINQLDDPAAGRATIDEYSGYTAHRSPEAYEVNEQLTAFYVDFDFEGEVAEMPWSVTAGLRYVQTDNAAKGQQIWLLDLVESPTEPGELRAIKSEDYLPVEVSHDYDDLLPTINGKIEFTDNLIGRFAYSKSITRPEIDEMSPITSYSGGMIDDLNGDGGNPKLAPFESTNYDLSLEWYYDEGSYAAVMAFKKDIDGYIDWEQLDETVTVPSGTYDYRIWRKTNLNNSTIDGYELVVQHLFTGLPGPFDGLGVMANLTFVDSESSENDPDEPFPLVGLGDSQNLILFYEKDAIQFRVAYNNRDEFMQRKGLSWRAPTYVDDYAQVDVSGSYDINDNLTVFFEGLNVTNELYRKRGLHDNHVLNVTETGPRYAIGIRGKF